MAGLWHGKLKRKDLEVVYDDFAEFSLSSPARKIRRLDAELPPIMEEGEPASNVPLNQQFLPEKFCATVSSLPNLGCPMSEPMLALPSNYERTLVVYKPVEMPLISSPDPANFSLKINSDIIDGLKNNVPKPKNRAFDAEDKRADIGDGRLAVIPWVPSQLATGSNGFGLSESSGKLAEVQMQAEEAGAESMEIQEVREMSTSSGAGNESSTLHDSAAPTEHIQFCDVVMSIPKHGQLRQRKSICSVNQLHQLLAHKHQWILRQMGQQGMAGVPSP